MVSLPSLKPNALIQRVKDNKVEIRGIINIWLAVVLDFFIALPLVVIVFGRRLFVEDHALSFAEVFTTTFVIVGLVLVVVPAIELLLNGTIIHLSLKLFHSPIPYARTILARTNGLLPFILLLPLKAILTPTDLLVPNFFWPPWTGLVVTLTLDLVSWPSFIEVVALELTLLNMAKIVVTFVLLLWTVKRTVGSLADIGEISKTKAFLATILQLVLWDVVSTAIAVIFSLGFN